MKNYNKIFKWLMLALIVVSFVLLVVGGIAGFESNGGVMTDVLLYWAYVMIAITLVAVIGFGLWIGIKNDPKILKKIGFGAIAVVVLCAISFLLAPGKPAMGLLQQPDAATLKLTDTILNLTYIVGGAAIVAIVFGEIRMSMISKKK